MTVPANPIRKSVHHDVLIDWFLCGWSYVMPDFDRPDFYKIEWLSTKAPVEPNNRVQPLQTESAEHERATSGA